MARPTKLSPDRHEALVRCLEGGVYRETAAQVCGIGVSTLYRWLEQGEAHAEDGVESTFRELFEAVSRAEAIAEQTMVQALFEAAPKDWRAAEAYLKRKNPERWSERHRLEHTGKDGGPVAFGEDLRQLSDEELQERIDELDRRRQRAP